MEYTRFEKARILGARPLQISMGAPFMLKLTQNYLEKLRYSPVEIAKLEFKDGLIPITVKRPFPIIDNYEKINSTKVKGVKKMEDLDYSRLDEEEEEKDPDEEDTW